MGCRIIPVPDLCWVWWWWRWIVPTVRPAANRGSRIRLMLFRRLEPLYRGRPTVTPKSRNGPVEQMRVLLVARRSGRQQRIQTLNQLRHLVFTAPESIRTRFKDRYKTGLVSEAANMGLVKFFV